jgi:hypothetical protein
MPVTPADLSSDPSLKGERREGGRTGEKKVILGWWHMSVTLALERLRQEDCKFKASLDYITRLKKEGTRHVRFLLFFGGVGLGSVMFCFCGAGDQT